MTRPDTFDFYTVEGIKSQLINSNRPTDIWTFKKNTGVIRSAFALLSAKYYRSNVFYITSTDADFSTINNVYYEMKEPSWHGSFQLINPDFFFPYYEGQD